MVDSHEELLEPVNKSGCSILDNVDWHSDISNRFDSCKPREAWQRLNCGTWITFVDFRQHGHFRWIHPYRITQNSARGLCHYPHTAKHNPFVCPQVGGWTNISEQATKTPEKIINWKDVSHAGIVFSYDWVRWDLQAELYEIAEKVLGTRPAKNPKAKLS
jgi:hypothetical protein